MRILLSAGIFWGPSVRGQCGRPHGPTSPAGPCLSWRGRKAALARSLLPEKDESRLQAGESGCSLTDLRARQEVGGAGRSWGGGFLNICGDSDGLVRPLTSPREGGQSEELEVTSGTGAVVTA